MARTTLDIDGSVLLICAAVRRRSKSMGQSPPSYLRRPAGEPPASRPRLRLDERELGARSTSRTRRPSGALDQSWERTVERHRRRQRLRVRHQPPDVGGLALELIERLAPGPDCCTLLAGVDGIPPRSSPTRIQPRPLTPAAAMGYVTALLAPAHVRAPGKPTSSELLVHRSQRCAGTAGPRCPPRHADAPTRRRAHLHP